jgi:prenyltransferase beta subunit
MRKYKLISVVFGFLLFLGVILNLNVVNRGVQPTGSYIQDVTINPASAKAPYQIINEIFDDKASNYETKGYFTEHYEPSLQATYYGLSILSSLGKLDTINESRMISYIMSYYNSSSGIFTDEYSSRYMGTDFSHAYYPLSSVLEVNCYALLSLSLLGNLGLINSLKSIDFLWSCYNPLSSGFIGQPYSSHLEEEFKISTMDNTYYAIITLDRLLSGWSGYSDQRNDLIAYINTLQNTNPVGWQYGGFYNDNSSLFNSLGILFEPNLLASYYSIKSLEVFGMVSSINDESFHQFLDTLYDPVGHYFRMSQVDFTNFSNIVATAIGLELSDTTNYQTLNESEVINFLYANRNEAGLWDGSTSIQKYELIDTFQIIRALDDAGEAKILTSDDTQQIVSSLSSLFSGSEGFSLISQEYSSMDLTYTIIKSFDLFNKIAELDLQALYSGIYDSYYYDSYFLYDGFMSYITKSDDNSYTGFRSYPLEYYSAGDRKYVDSGGYLLSHKATYQALDSLQRMHKLDDFALIHNLSRLLENIVDTQFLDEVYPDQNGAFLPIMEFDPLKVELQSKNIFFEYSFYAIRTMEFLTEQLHIGDITFIDFDITELYNYILAHTIETSELLYYQAHYSDDIDIILQNTYYMIYILKVLDLYNFDNKKIESYIIQNIDYTNLKNIFYCYKISELLDLELEFDAELLQGLIESIYIDSLHEFYMTPSRDIISQEALLWICDMATSDPLEIVLQYDEQILLGTYLSLSASLSNLILSEFDYNLSFQFECAQLGIFILDKEDDNQFSLTLFVPQRSTNYPNLEGALVAYDGLQKLTEKSISINTVYNQKYYKDDMNAAIGLSVLFLGVPGGFVLISGKKIKKLS